MTRSRKSVKKNWTFEDVSNAIWWRGICNNWPWVKKNGLLTIGRGRGSCSHSGCVLVQIIAHRYWYWSRYGITNDNKPCQGCLGRTRMMHFLTDSPASFTSFSCHLSLQPVSLKYLTVLCWKGRCHSSWCDSQTNCQIERTIQELKYF